MLTLFAQLRDAPPGPGKDDVYMFQAESYDLSPMSFQIQLPPKILGIPTALHL